MIFMHYNGEYIICSDDQFVKLLDSLYFICEIFGRKLTDCEIEESLREDDSIFYAASFLFLSRKDLDDLDMNYIQLARLIFLRNNKDIDEKELNYAIYYYTPQ